jgi:hypothetical protein
VAKTGIRAITTEFAQCPLKIVKAVVFTALVGIISFTFQF